MASLQNGLIHWAGKAECGEIDIVQTNQFARIWIYSIMYGITLAIIITIPFTWCKPAKKKLDETLDEASLDHSQTALDAQNMSTAPDMEAAQRHLVRTSCTKDRKWYNPITTPGSVLSEVGGTGTELYFRMLRNFGFMYAYMAAFTAPIPAFSMVGDFLPDTGQFLAKTTIGNMGSYADATVVDPSERIVQIGCQGVGLSDMTHYFGWLDFIALLIFFSFVVYFRFRAIPKIAEQDEKEQITPKDFSVTIDCLPATIENHADYERLLNEHIASRLEYARSRLKEEHRPAHNVEVCEITLVRDYGGRLGEIRERANLQKSKEIAEAYENNEKAVEKLSAKLEALEEKLAERLKPDEELPVVRAFCILNCKADVALLLNDYRFADFSLFRLCQFSDRRFQGRKIRVRSAPEPTDILWENQDCSYGSRLMRKSLMLGIFILILLISLVTIYTVTVSGASTKEGSGLSYMGDAKCDPKDVPGDESYKCIAANTTDWNITYVEAEGGDILNCWCSTQGYSAVFADTDILSTCSPWLIGLAVAMGASTGASCCVVVINAVLQMVLIAMAEFEKPLSLTALNSSMMRKVFMAQTMNTGFILLFVNTNIQAIQDAVGDIPGIGPMLFNGSFDDVNRNWYTVVGTTLLTNMMLNAVTPAGVSCAKAFVLFAKRRFLKGGKKHQAELIELHTNPEFDIKGKYAQFLTTVFVTMMYSSGLPLMHMFGCGFMFCMYWADKFVLLWASKRPPNYDTTMARDASEYMLYVIPLHCIGAIFMYGQECVFPSKTLGGALGDVASQGAGYAPGILQNLGSRVSLESTWMIFLLFVLIVGAWVLWTVLWILGGTFGSLWDIVVATCCPAKPKVMDEEEVAALEKGQTSTKMGGSIDIAATMNWVAASEHIERTFPPASYKLERNPDMETIAHLLRPPNTPKSNPSSPGHPPPVSVGNALSSMDQPAQPAAGPPVSTAVAKGFLEALNSEYVLETGPQVGKFFEATPGVEDKLNSFEEQVRAAENKNAEIESIAKTWGMSWP
mmetsp:Transcript_25411/g.46121  ORF Transcript_25411/g.46121 Transcript_25411/m.46121 type:complete len:1023 (+) Transcript_25411:81-3149(+)